MKIVEVHWVDSASVGGWTNDPECTCIACKTVGYLIKKDRDEVVVAQCTSDEMLYDNKFVIPRGCIKSIREIK